MEVFDLNNYTDEDYVMHCNTREKAQFFLRYLHSMGRRWTDGTSYVSHDDWEAYTDQTVYYFNEGLYSNLPYAIESEKCILEFDDFDWSGVNVTAFKPGDRVRVIGGADSYLLGGDRLILYGESGIVRVVGDDVGVEFDRPHTRLHDLGGHCRNGYGWWFNASELKLTVQNKGEDLLAILNDFDI